MIRNKLSKRQKPSRNPKMTSPKPSNAIHLIAITSEIVLNIFGLEIKRAGTFWCGEIGTEENKSRNHFGGLVNTDPFHIQLVKQCNPQTGEFLSFPLNGWQPCNTKRLSNEEHIHQKRKAKETVGQRRKRVSSGEKCRNPSKCPSYAKNDVCGVWNPRQTSLKGRSRLCAFVSGARSPRNHPRKPISRAL